MNDFSSTDNNGGLLKNTYDQGAEPLEIALKKRREALMQSKGMSDKEATKDELKP